MFRIGAFGVGAGLSALAMGQVFSGSGGDIPDGQGDTTFFRSAITVSGLAPGQVLDSATLFITHAWVGDLVAILTAPNGDNVHLFSRLGATPQFILGDSSNLSIDAGPYTFRNTGPSFLAAAVEAGDTLETIEGGTYARSSTLGGFDRPVADPDDFTVFNGDNLNGIWSLTLQDWITPDPGTLAAWSIRFLPVPAPGTTLPLIAALGLLTARRKR